MICWQSFLFLGHLSNPTVLEFPQHSDIDVVVEICCIDKETSISKIPRGGSRILSRRGGRSGGICQLVWVPIAVLGMCYTKQFENVHCEIRHFSCFLATLTSHGEEGGGLQPPQPFPWICPWFHGKDEPASTMEGDGAGTWE